MSAESARKTARTAAVPVHVLLDVDGVLNAVRFGRPPQDGWPRHAKYKHIFGRYEGAPMTGEAHGAFPIRYSPDLVEALNELAARPEVAMHWLTTWLDEARFGLAPRIGLNGVDWPVLGKDERRLGSPGWWKLAAARAHASEHPGVRIVWIDDDLDDAEAQEWVGLMSSRVFAVRPESDVGLTPGHLVAINAWVAGDRVEGNAR